MVLLDGDVGENPRSGPDRVEHARSSRRDRSEVLEAKAGPESGVPCFHPRAGSSDDDRFGDARQPQFNRSLDGGAGPDANVFFAIRREPLELDLEHVRTRRQSQKAQVPLVVRDQSRRAANQGRGADTNDRTPKDAALCVLDGADKCTRQRLRGGHPRQQHTGGHEQIERPSQARGGWRFDVHVIRPLPGRPAVSRKKSSSGRSQTPKPRAKARTGHAGVTVALVRLHATPLGCACPPRRVSTTEHQLN